MSLFSKIALTVFILENLYGSACFDDGFFSTLGEFCSTYGELLLESSFTEDFEHQRAVFSACRFP